jgi:hypothetical protein
MMQYEVAHRPKVDTSARLSTVEAKSSSVAILAARGQLSQGVLDPASLGHEVPLQMAN